MGRISRRQFLAQSSLATAAAAFAPRAFAAPNDLFRIAVVGVRGRGMDHVKAYADMKDVQVAAICDVDENVIGPAMKRLDGKAAFAQDLRKILDDKSIDAVSIASTNHTHALFSIWAMQAGKHVYVEKPVSHSLREGRRMVEAARKYSRVCQTGTQTRSSRAVREAIGMMQDGRIGKIRTARGLCYKRRDSIGVQEDGPVPAGVDYNLWLGPAPERPFNPNRFHYNWHWNWDYGNGDLGNTGIHQMDVLRWGLGKKELPRKVISAGGRFGYRDDGETPNSQLTLLDYGDAQIVFEVRGLPSPEYRGVKVGMIFHCADGYLAIPKGDQAAMYNRDDEVIQKFSGGGDHFRNFVDAAKAGKPGDLAADIEEGHLSSALCHLGNISYRLGGLYAMYKAYPFRDHDAADSTFDRWKAHLDENCVKADQTQMQVGKTLTIDPKTETFVDDPEADKLLTREYRKPFVVPDRL